MKYQSDEDLFSASTMTFGEHLDELRGALIRALVGLTIGTLLGLTIGKQIVAAIQHPLQSALSRYYTDNAESDYLEWKQRFADQGVAFPYTQEEYNAVVTQGELPELRYIDVAQFGRTEKEEAAKDKAANDAGEPPPASGAGDKASKAVAVQLSPILIWHPIADDPRIQAKTFGMPESFTIFLKASLITGAVLSSPWVFYQLWMFVAAGLYPHEKRYVHIFLPFSVGLFLLGAATAYLFVFEPVLDFMLGFNRWLDLGVEPRISEWLGFVLMLPIGFGLAFQLPLVMLFLERIGIFDVKMYLAKWRIAILVVFVLSAILTPADPYSLLLMATPVSLLYGVGILMCRWFPRGGSPVT